MSLKVNLNVGHRQNDLNVITLYAIYYNCFYDQGSLIELRGNDKLKICFMPRY